MELLKELYLSKSCFIMGTEQKKCYNCSYCRALNGYGKELGNYIIPPSEINDLFIDLPICVNLFYGDPMLQIENTKNILENLENIGHRGTVIIITKGDIDNLLKLRTFNLDLHIGLSTFGMNSKYDGGSFDRFKSNCEKLHKDGRYKFSIEFRPIIKNINDSDEVFENVCSVAENYNLPIGYCGLQVNDELRKHIEKENLPFEPYDGYEFGLRKYVSKDVVDRLQKIADEHGVYIFKKTSCLISYMNNKDRDYNAHFYRPNEVGCYKCPMKEKCFKFKEENSKKTTLDIQIPFDYKLIHKENHVCPLYSNGLCKFPSDDCKNISGKIIKIDEPITTTDVRVIKWLTGFTVDAPFTELPYISKKWKQNEV